MGDTCNISRKTSSSRKRSRDHIAKTPNKVSTSSKSQRQFSPRQTRATRAQEKAEIVDSSCAKWIDNSFMAGMMKTKAKDLSLEAKKQSGDSGNSEQKVDKVANITGVGGDHLLGSVVFSSTPMRKTKVSQLKTEESADYYCSQHQSFDDSDTSFVDMIAGMEDFQGQLTDATQPKSVSKDKTDLIRPKSVGKNRTTTVASRRGHNKSLNSTGFDSDDGLFAELDFDEWESVSVPRDVPCPASQAVPVIGAHKDCSNISCINRDPGSASCSDCGSGSSVTQFRKPKVSSSGSIVVNTSSKLSGDAKHKERTKPPSAEHDTELAAEITDSLDCLFFPESSPSPKVESPVKKAHSTPQNNLNNLSFKDRLKRTLEKNANASSPFLNRAERRKEQKLEVVLKEAADLQQDGASFDIGPFYGLPSKVQELLHSQRGIKDLYAWQHECLSLPAVKEGKNLIYSLPTSGGKTLVAEILILRELLCKQKDALLILPFVSIVQEKVRGLSQFAVDLDFLVEEYAASKGQFPPHNRRTKKSLYIATIEKANSLVNSLIETKRLNHIGLVVVDELHMLSEGGSRGATLEMTLAKVRHASKATQIIGMSATLNNISDLQHFLDAELYTNDFRPVVLTEYVKMEQNIFEVDPSALCPDDRVQHDRILLNSSDTQKQSQDPDQLAALVLEVIPDHSCLVFCPTKKNCENVATLLCKLIPRKLRERKKDERLALLAALREDGDGKVCPVLKVTLAYGIAYHHSGLTMDERKLIEEAYSEGTLCLLTCTSTLAAGVNVPAKRVILRSPYVGQSFLSRSQYKQMIGRAGRAGIDASGESILILQRKDKLRMLGLISGPCDTCTSSLLYEGGKGLRAFLLTAIGLKITPSTEDILDFMKKSLCNVQSQQLKQDIPALVKTSLQQLLDSRLVIQYRPKVIEGSEVTDKPEVTERSEDKEERSLPVLEVTNLGRAVFKGSIDLDRGPQLYKDLRQAQQNLIVTNYLHLLYLVTPYDMVEQVTPIWMTYLDQLSCLDSTETKVANSVGVSESYVTRRATGQRVKKTVDEFPIKRFYLTLMLYQLWRHRNIWEVSVRFQQPRGFIQQLLTGAASFASCVARFCQELEEFWAYQELLNSFVKRLSYCVSMELVPLLEIPGVKMGRSRQLYNAGFRTLQEVAYADPETLVKKIEHMPRRVAKQLVASAQMLLTEKAENLRQEAEDLVAMPTDGQQSETESTVVVD